MEAATAVAPAGHSGNGNATAVQIMTGGNHGVRRTSVCRGEFRRVLDLMRDSKSLECRAAARLWSEVAGHLRASMKLGAPVHMA